MVTQLKLHSILSYDYVKSRKIENGIQIDTKDILNDLMSVVCFSRIQIVCRNIV